MAAAHGWTLVSFDVDGTLITSVGQNANKLHKEAFTAGFKEVFGLDTHIDVIPHHGSTDPLIIVQVMHKHHGLDKAEVMAALPRVQAVMTSHVAAHEQRAADGLQLLPGVRDLLAALQARERVATCLVTGNLQPIGWAKMRALGVDGLFTQPRFGGFGSDYCSGNTDESWRDRAQLVKVAAEKGAVALLEGTETQDNNSNTGTGPWGARFHVGDTPMDIQAALEAGAVAIGVTTGIYSEAQLRAAAPPGSEAAGRLVLLPDLADTSAVLAALKLT